MAVGTIVVGALLVFHTINGRGPPAPCHRCEVALNAGWALETQRADSHTDRVTHHALQVADEPDEDGNDVYNIFELFKPEHNRHRPFESEDGSVVAVQEGEEER